MKLCRMVPKPDTWVCPECAFHLDGNPPLPIRCRCGYSTDGRRTIPNDIAQKLHELGLKPCSEEALQWLRGEGVIPE